MEHVISFPGLGLEFTLRRVAFSVFGKEIFWYGIIICFGFLLAAVYVARRTKEFGMTIDNEIDMIFCAVPVSILCARLYYVVFLWENYRDNLSEIVKVWHGGLAIYGGIIGAMLVIFVYGRYKRLNILRVMDVGALGLLIGQSIGRWGNFVNAEAFGTESRLPWAMSIDGLPTVHPTFLYESLWNAAGFLLLHFHSKKRRFDGELLLLYLAWYGLGRAWIEGLRTDSLYFFGTGLRTSQALAVLTCAVAVCLLVIGYRRRRVYAVDTAIHIPGETTGAVSGKEEPVTETEKKPETTKEGHQE